MGHRLFFSSTVKQNALTLFRSGVSASFASKELGVPLYMINAWFHRFSENHTDWVQFDDEDFILRGKALALFEQGFGYKRVAKLLKLSTSRVKYWQQMYKFKRLEFFFEGQKPVKSYSNAFKKQMLESFKSSGLSKKAFCGQNKIAVSSLNSWLDMEFKTPESE